MIAGWCPHRGDERHKVTLMFSKYQSVRCMDLASLAIVDQPQATCTLKPIINLKTYFLGEVQTAGKLYAWPWQQFSTFIHCKWSLQQTFYHSGMLWPFQIQYYHRIAPFPKLKCLCGLVPQQQSIMPCMQLDTLFSKLTSILWHTSDTKNDMHGKTVKETTNYQDSSHPFPKDFVVGDTAWSPHENHKNLQILLPLHQKLAKLCTQVQKNILLELPETQLHSFKVITEAHCIKRFVNILILGQEELGRLSHQLLDWLPARVANYRDQDPL